MKSIISLLYWILEAAKAFSIAEAILVKLKSTTCPSRLTTWYIGPPKYLVWCKAYQIDRKLARANTQRKALDVCHNTRCSVLTYLELIH